MGNIRRQTILSSIVIYIGFAIGALNTYLYVKNGSFTTLQYGLTKLFNDIGFTFFSFATLGVLSFIYKFHPFYKQNLSVKQNDQVAISVFISAIGFLLLTTGSIIFKPFFVRKFSEKSALLVSYYYWILPYAFGILFFSVFEVFAWYVNKSIFTNFLKETGIRIVQLLIILLYLFKLISFDLFIKIFSFSFIVIAMVLVNYLYFNGDIHFNFKISRVTRKFYKKILTLMAFIYGSLVINTLAQYIDPIIIASVSSKGLSDVGVYTLASFIATIIVVPQRSIIAATVPVLSFSWKKKDYNEIHRIYNRTSINLLILALLIFCLIWLNVDQVFNVLNINKDYEAGKMVILFLGLSKIVDAGTGVNGQIIATSNFWRFDMLTGVFLLGISIPLNYILVKHFGINGSAISNLIAFTSYNLIRMIFIYRKFSMQPFSLKTGYALGSALFIFALIHFLFHSLNGLTGILLRSVLFLALYSISIISLKMSPDFTHFFFKTTNLTTKFLRKKK